MASMTYSSPELRADVEKIFQEQKLERIIGNDEIGEILAKTGITWDAVGKKVADVLSRYLSGGLVQLTVERIRESDEFRREASGKKGMYEVKLTKVPKQKLAAIEPYVDVAIRAGAIDLYSFRLNFLAETEVEVKEPSLTIDDKKITRIACKSLDTSCTLSVIGAEKPFRLHTWTFSMKLPEIDLTSFSVPEQ